MLFRRIAFIGIMLAAVSAAVIQVRLMNAAAAREIHLLVARQQQLQRQIHQQEIELARLRTPQRIVDRLTAAGTEFLPPGADRASDQPRQVAEAVDTPTPSVPMNLAAQSRQGGGRTQSWPSHAVRNNSRRPAR